VSQAFVDWSREREIDVRYVQPGKPDQNAFIERFDRSYRNEVLSAHLFESMADVQEITDDSLRRYNEVRPHDALGRLPPARYRDKLLSGGNVHFRTVCLTGELTKPSSASPSRGRWAAAASGLCSVCMR
jgi:putative transposase